MYIITARRITSSELLNQRKGLRIAGGYGMPSYVRKLVTELSGGVFGYLDSVLERHSFDEFGELI